MRASLFSLIAVAVVAVAGCEPAAEVVAPVADASFARSPKAVVHQVSAGGIVDYTAQGSPGLVEQYGFTASVDGAGNARGQLQTDWDDGLKFHMEITCLVVDGNQAWLGGVITKTTGSGVFAVGSEWVWSVADNGEGAAAAPDELTFFFPYPATLCGDRVPYGAFAWTHGNVQVR